MDLRNGEYCGLIKYFVKFWVITHEKTWLTLPRSKNDRTEGPKATRVPRGKNNVDGDGDDDGDDDSGGGDSRILYLQ